MKKQQQQLTIFMAVLAQVFIYLRTNSWMKEIDFVVVAKFVNNKCIYFFQKMKKRQDSL